MRFLFTTLQFAESDFYERVSSELRDRGHDAFHLTWSLRAAESARRAGFESWCLPELMKVAGTKLDVDAEARRIEDTYAIPSLRDVYLSDPACASRSEGDCVEWTVRHFIALERVFDEARPDVVVPEVGSETMRTAAHLIGRQRDATVLFLFYTIFPRPLRLYVNTYHAPIVPPEEVRPLDAAERAEVESFISYFTGRGRPILAHRRARVSLAKLRDFARHVYVRNVHERDNEYLRTGRFVTGYVKQRARVALARRLYDEPGERPFVYFPLHVTNDFKVMRVIPHCVDQEYLIQQLSDSLPQGCDIVLKEHPVSIGRNPVRFLWRLKRAANVRLVDPHTSSHELIRDSAAVAVISSTVGLEALLYGKPVLTLGQPFYSGYGVTVDVDSFRELREAVPRVLEFEPDRELVLQFLHAAMRSTYRGAPAGVDGSEANAVALASSLDEVARRIRPLVVQSA
jgi:capsular polysaccharide biosynthesis protein